MLLDTYTLNIKANKLALLINNYKNNKIALDLVKRVCVRLYTIPALLQDEYHNLNLWYFVSFMSGIIYYFNLDKEPTIHDILLYTALALGSLYLKTYEIFGKFISSLIIAFTLGLLVSKYRVENINTNFIQQSFISNVYGTVESAKPITRGLQIVLNNVKLSNFQHSIYPEKIQKIRLTIQKKYGDHFLLGDTIKVRAKLYKPQNNIVPGGYDFGFYAYFAGVSASGYAMSPPEIVSHKNQQYFSSIIYKIRQKIYHRITQKLGVTKGNFIAAILLGESKAIDPNLMQAMRQSGISHILCVSGLHLSLVAMIYFISTRFLLNLFDCIAFNFNTKLIAAIISLAGSYIYLHLSGMQIAATRAFIMTAIFIIGIITERTCYPLRSIAVAAAIILTLNPEYLFHPSFQLSFIAVLSLVSGYEYYLKNKWILGDSKGVFAALKFYLASNIYSSFLAGIVTAPLVINQFYIFSTYSIIANLIAVPIMSFFLMPLAILELILMPIGLDNIILELLGFFIQIIITSAQTINNWNGSVWYFGHVSKLSILIFLFGFFWICIWQTVWRKYGIIIMLLSVILMFNSTKPDIIFDYNIKALGVKNMHQELEIYANNIPNFTKKYWANWFGQNDANLITYLPRIINTYSGYKLVINNMLEECIDSDIQINLGHHKCTGKKLTISQDLLKEVGVITILCNNISCNLAYNTNSRFKN